MFTNELDTKEIHHLFFIFRNQILDSQLWFRYIWMKSWKNWRLFEKTGAKKVELFNFNSKFRNGFWFYDRSNDGKRKPQPYTFPHSKVVCILSKHLLYNFFHFSNWDNVWSLTLKWNSMRCLIWWTIGQMSTFFKQT